MEIYIRASCVRVVACTAACAGLHVEPVCRRKRSVCIEARAHERAPPRVHARTSLVRGDWGPKRAWMAVRRLMRASVEATLH